MVEDRTEGLAERLHRLRDERSTVTELRTKAELDAALAAAQGVAGRAWERTGGCTRIDHGDVAACRRTIEPREARARAERRDGVDRDIAALEDRLNGAHTIAAGDPGPRLWRRRCCGPPSA
jgi:hypothetical protein